jgi:hypothetical protein
MRRNSALNLIFIVAIVAFFSNVLTFTIKTDRVTESYPSVVCPPNAAGQNTQISVTSPKVEIRKTGTSSMLTKIAGARRITASNQATVLDAGSNTPVVWQTNSGTWAGSVPCLAPVTTQWFIGATADVTSKGDLTIVNSGLGRALVQISLFTESGSQEIRSISIKANSFTTLPLASLAPGSKAIALKIAPLTGRVNAFVVDERGKGLHALGGDLVNSVVSPSRTVVIPAIPQQTGKKSSTPHTLRILVPGQVSAHISAAIASTDGTFPPAGIDGKTIPAGKVVELPIDYKMAQGKFALQLTSDQPLIASVFSKTLVQGKGDFVWSTGAPEMKPFTLAATGLSPTLVFTGAKIKISAALTDVNGKSQSVEIVGEDIATFQVPDRIRSVTFMSVSRQTYGAALMTSKSGYGYIPLLPGSELTKSTIPRSNIRVLLP